MAKSRLTVEERREIEDFLKGYGVNLKFVNAAAYEDEYFGGGRFAAPEGYGGIDVPVAKARMFRVRHFILELDNSDEKLFLYYRYVKGESMERCAELFGISRSTVYRLSDRALSLAYRRQIMKNK